MSILETVSNVATILGFGLSSYEFLVRRNPGDKPAQYLGILLEFAPLTEAWKAIHRDYHTILPDVDNLVSLISVYDGRNVSMRAVSDIKPRDIESCFTSGNLSHALTDFQSRLSPSIGTLRLVRVDSNNQPDLDIIGRSGNRDISMCIERIVISTRQVLKAHEEFCYFLQESNRRFRTSKFSKQDLEYIVGSRKLLSNDFHRVILDADRALIAMLDIYKKIIDEVGNGKP